ncbi:OB-fold nucleic acid binding domain-containing protein [Methanotorris igneus]|uniref:Nucleic acid binding OB-fold tRNA/helicase-type n=1 Tax=Methanotorris igneus (strain DSM 5666 / JCM 11834 / Kol 5) TaxID=880724 RepID=F6BBG8_METIK|nr:OB-fold nucleic acid binding domain-containing protein [Methanotorris igneus]AEF97175.1 nucleic acid binding OB-fold tRNA/helicase-type [Methanotorris igneus Kol 5]
MNDKHVIAFCLIFAVLGLISLNFYTLEPKDVKICEIKDGDYVKITGYIQKLIVKRDEYRHILEVKSLTISDGTGHLNVVAFGKVREELTNYIKDYQPCSIKEEDKVQVIGKISTYNGRYQLILEDIDNFKLIEKLNFEKDIYLSPIPTHIYASKYGKTYHTSEDCPYGKKIKKDNRIYFYSEEDAEELGYKKCKWCSKNANK